MASRSAEASATRKALLSELEFRSNVRAAGATFRLTALAFGTIDCVIAALLFGADASAAAVAWTLCSVLSHALRLVELTACAPGFAASRRSTRVLTALWALTVIRTSLVAVLLQAGGLHRYLFVSAFIVATGICAVVALNRPAVYLQWALPMAAAFAAGLLIQPRFEALAEAFVVTALIGVVAACARAKRNMTEDMLTLLQRRDQTAEALRLERDVAAESSASKTRFFAAASHDLRQPLHALSINATTLQLVAGKQPDPVIRDLSQSINRALLRSNGLLDSLLDLSRLDAKAVDLNIEAVGVLALLTAVADQFQPAADERGLALVVDPATASIGERTFIDTDVGLMLRVLGNLVSNAIKFTSLGSVRLSAHIDEAAEPASVILQVADTGRGIAPTELQRVFEEFYQIGNPQKDADGGLGLGLSIVRRAADLMRVTVEIHSVVGKGTVVSLKVPRASRLPSAYQFDRPVKAAPEEIPHEQIRALLVEDEKEICDSIRGFLPYLGYEVRSASDTAEALALVAGGFMPTVLVIDQLLRHETGLLVAHRLWRVLGRIPAVMVTGDTDPATMELALASGMRVIHKPVDGMRLVNILREVQRGAA